MCARVQPRRSGDHPDLGAPGGAPRKAAVEFGLDEWDHVDAVDAQEALAVTEKRIIDIHAPRIDAAHHDAGQVSLDKPGATQVRADELRSLQIGGLGESCHDFSLSSACCRWCKLAVEATEDRIILDAHGRRGLSTVGQGTTCLTRGGAAHR